MRHQPLLVIVTPPRRGGVSTEPSEYEFNQESIIVGRGAAAHLVLADNKASTLHAVIKVASSFVTVVDLDSDSGTFVNGVRTTESRLHHGDRLHIGGTQILVQLPDVSPASSLPTAQITEDEATVRGEPLVFENSNRVSEQARSRLGNEPSPKPLRSPLSRVTPTDVSPRVAPREPKGKGVGAAKAPPVAAAKPSAPIDPTLINLEGELASVELNTRGIPRAVSRDFASASAASDPEHATLKFDGRASWSAEASAPRRLEVRQYWGNDLIDVVELTEGTELYLDQGLHRRFAVHRDRRAKASTSAAKKKTLNAPVQELSGRMLFVRTAPGGLPLGATPEPATVFFHPHMQVEWQGRNGLKTFEPSGQKSLIGSKLSTDDRVLARLGPLTMGIRWLQTPAPKATPLPWSQRFDRSFATTLLGCVCLALLLFLLLLLGPHDDEASDKLVRSEDRFAQLVLTHEKPTPAAKLKDPTSAKATPKAAPAHPPTSHKTAQPVSSAKWPVAHAHVDRAVAAKPEKAVGILGALQGDGALGSLLAPSVGSGSLDSALAGLHANANTPETASGRPRGTSAPQGQTLGIGAIGRSDGRSSARDTEVDLGGKDKGERTVENSKTSHEPVLSQEAVARVLDRSKSQLRYCYERELQRQPDLSGKVVVKFEIVGDGSVPTAQVASSTLNNAATEECLVRVYKRLRFPAPRGGATLSVNYPMIFNKLGAQ